MPGDRIFVSIDPPNYYVEKFDKIDMDVTNRQTCKLDVVQSNAKDDERSFVFGDNAVAKASPEHHASVFGRTASAVFRMVMLEAVQIPDKLWPKIAKRTFSRNKAAMKFEVNTEGDNAAFQLLNDNNTKENAREYWSRYDQAFPHSLIKNEVLEHEGEQVPFKNTMFILRRPARQVIEITTKAYATMYPPCWKVGEIDCNVEVSCICKTFDQNNANDKILNGLTAEVDASSSSTSRERSRSSVLKLLKKSSN